MINYVITKLIDRKIKIKFKLFKILASYFPLDMYGWHEKSNLQAPKSNGKQDGIWQTF